MGRFIAINRKRGASVLLYFFMWGWVSLANTDVLKCIHQSRKEFLVDWKRIKAEYIAGGTSYRKLAKKYNVSFTTLTRTAQRENWVELRQQAEDKTTTKILESVSDDSADKAVNIISVADKLLNKISELIDKAPNTQSIKNLTSALKDLKEIKGYKSAADMKEQEARIAKLQKEAEKVEDNNVNEIEVVFTAGPEEWNE